MYVLLEHAGKCMHKSISNGFDLEMTDMLWTRAAKQCLFICYQGKKKSIVICY